MEENTYKNFCVFEVVRQETFDKIKNSLSSYFANTLEDDKAKLRFIKIFLVDYNISYKSSVGRFKTTGDQKEKDVVRVKNKYAQINLNTVFFNNDSDKGIKKFVKGVGFLLKESSEMELWLSENTENSNKLLKFKGRIVNYMLTQSSNENIVNCNIVFTGAIKQETELRFGD